MSGKVNCYFNNAVRKLLFYENKNLVKRDAVAFYIVDKNVNRVHKWTL